MNRRYWDKMASVYDVFMRKDRKAYGQMYERIRQKIRGKIVLELATGTGLIAQNTADAALRMIATDFSAQMLEKAKRKPRPDPLTYAQADACALPYADHSFDVVIISNALHIIPSPETVLAEIRRVLKCGGLLIAPTFIHGDLQPSQQRLAKIMKLFTGFRAEHVWTRQTYTDFLQVNGWTPIRTKVLEASFPLLYAECRASGEGRKKEDYD